MSGRLGKRLPLGQLVAVLADEASFEQVTTGVRGALDYFQRTERDGSAAHIAAERLGEALADPSRQLYVLEDPAKGPVGMLDLALNAPTPGEATLALLVLDQRRRGQGIGREIVETLFAALAAAGFERVRLGVAPGETQAAHFWSAVGMWPCGEDRGVKLFERPLR
ncbi:MAG: GNAT family N-acetyltransferase [Deltaproteobacteria bacterium]|nr:GNAT family N-acetyltransferase [Deltaproteobacteria bacterium]